MAKAKDKAADKSKDKDKDKDKGKPKDNKPKDKPQAKAKANKPAAKGKAAATAEKAPAADEQPVDDRKLEPRLRETYAKDVVPALMKRFGYKNPMQVPRLSKIVINMGLGEAVANPKVIDTAVQEVMAITGQRPVVTRAKKSIATFKLRQGMPIGVKCTLRRERMWEFLDRLVSLSLPRVRDFRGTSPKGFDGAGNYTLGLREQIVFPEINFDKVEKVKGMNITFVTTAENNEEAKELLGRLGMPFRS
jgi:large subunit ribosomal protein L5